METHEDYYAVLGIPRTATAKEIKKAYHRQALKFHPDQNPGDKPAEKRMAQINEAHDTLSDPQKRAAYDRYGYAAFQRGFNPDTAARPQTRPKPPKKPVWKKKPKDYVQEFRYQAMETKDAIHWSITKQWDVAISRAPYAALIGAGLANIQFFNGWANLLTTLPASLLVGFACGLAFLAVHHGAIYSSAIGRFIGKRFGAAMYDKDVNNAKRVGANRGGALFYIGFLTQIIGTLAYQPSTQLLKPVLENLAFS